MSAQPDEDEGNFTAEEHRPQNAQTVDNEDPGTQEQQSAPIRTFLPPTSPRLTATV